MQDSNCQVFVLFHRDLFPQKIAVVVVELLAVVVVWKCWNVVIVNELGVIVFTA